MVKYIKQKLKSYDNRRLLENFISLSVLQGANYLLPLITLPYLVRVLGPEKFGLVSFATVTVTYFQIITDYGFNFSACRDISLNRDNHNKIEEIYSSVMILKFIFVILSFIILMGLIFTFKKFNNNPKLYFITFGSIIGQFLFPVWLFQGLEKMKFITGINIFSKIIFTFAVFIFVNKSTDYLLVPVCNSLGFIIGGIVSIMIVRLYFRIKFKIQKPIILYNYLKGGFYIFISNISISLYTVSTIFILGLLTNNTIVGIYSAGEKIIKAIQGLVTPVSQSIYPFISLRVKKSPVQGIKIINKTALILNSLIFILASLVFVFAEPITLIVLGAQYSDSATVVRILSFIPLFTGISNIYAIVGLYNFNKQKIVSRFVLVTAIVHVLISIILVTKFNYIGSAISILFTEMVIAICSWLFFKTNIEKKVLI